MARIKMPKAYTQDQVEEVVSNIIDREITPELMAMYEPIKAQANKIVSIADNLHKNFINLQMELGNKVTPSQLKKFSSKMVTNTEDLKVLVNETLVFQNQLNLFLNQKVEMVFVYRDSNNKINLYNLENDVSDLTPDKASESHGGTYTMRYQNSKILQQAHTSNLLKSLKSPDETGLTKTYNTVYSRAEFSKERVKMNGAFFIWWKESGGTYDKRWISSMGAIAESYVKFFIEEYLFSENIEDAVKNYILHKTLGVMAGDNESGFLAGDYSKNGIEYGVKTSGATALSYVQIIQAAKDISSISSVQELNVKVANLKGKLMKKAVKNLARPLQQAEEDTVNNLIKESLALES